MQVLVPVDGSDCSFRALEFAVDLVRRREGTLHVVHFTDVETDATEQILDRAEAVLADTGVVDDPEVRFDARMSEPRYANAVGKEILRIVNEEGYDHVVMGHHGAGIVGRAILGSAAETVLRASDVPVTVIP